MYLKKTFISNGVVLKIIFAKHTATFQIALRHNFLKHAIHDVYNVNFWFVEPLP